MLLIITLQNWIVQINVFTQKQNSLACAFYEKNGFSPTSTEYVYHLWLRNRKDADTIQ